MLKMVKTIKNIIFVALIGVVAFVLSGLLLGLFGGLDDDLRFVVTYSMPIVLMLIGVSIYDIVECHRPQRVMWGIRGLNPAMHLWGLILLVTLSVVLSPLMRLLPANDADVPSSLWAVVTMIFIAPLFEEILFRGKLFSVLRATLSPTLSALVVSAIFALMHGFSGVTIEAFFAGMIFSYAYLATGSIFAPVILHVFNNVIAYVLVQFEYQERTIVDYIGDLPSFDIIYAISLLVLIIGVVFIVRTFYRADRNARNDVSQQGNAQSNEE